MVTSSRSKSEGGSILIIVLILLVFFSVIIVGLGPLIQNQTVHVAFSRDAIKANYLAEAAVKRGAQYVVSTLLPTTIAVGGTSFRPELVSDGNVTESILTGGPSYMYKYHYVAGDGYDSPTNPTRIEVTGTSKISNYAGKSLGWIVFSPMATANQSEITLKIHDLVEEANKKNTSHIYHWESKTVRNNNKWTVSVDGDGRDYATPPNGNSHNYILFEDDCKPEFRVDYTTQFQKATESGGVGVIYGVTDSTDTADNFSGYCVKFNNDRKNFAVTIFDGQDTNYCPDEAHISKTDAGPGAYGSANTKDDMMMFQPNGSLGGNASFDGTDAYGNKLGRSAIGFDELSTKMKAYYKEYEDTFKAKHPDYEGEILLPDGRPIPKDASGNYKFDFATTSEYMISVETKLENVTVWYMDGRTKKSRSETRLRQNIYIDGNKVLSFIDFSDVTPVKASMVKRGTSAPFINLKGATRRRTGLRIVNVTNSLRFYNSTNLSFGHTVVNFSALVWKRAK